MRSIIDSAKVYPHSQWKCGGVAILSDSTRRVAYVLRRSEPNRSVRVQETLSNRKKVFGVCCIKCALTTL
jgi:hypothetical protein